MTRLALALLFLPLLAVPALAQVSAEVTEADIFEAEKRRRAAGAELEATTARYEAARARQFELQEDVQVLAIEIEVKERELVALRHEARRVVREIYMTVGAEGGAGSLLMAASFTEVPVRATYLEIANEREVSVLTRLAALEESYRDQQARIVDAVSEQQQIVADLATLSSEILSELEAADAAYEATVAQWERQEEERRRREEEQRRRAEEERRQRAEADRQRQLAAAAAATTTSAPATTTAAPATSTSTTATVTSTTVTSTTAATTVAPDSGDETTTTTPAATTTTTPPPAAGDSPGRVCPVAGAVTFSDTWGAKRSGNRTHKGVDMVAARGTPIVAIEAGTITRVNTSSLGGKQVRLAGESGDHFYYAHLDDWADGLHAGQQVGVGERVGSNGSTGNASDSLPHLHFEHYPGGGAPSNPYPLVASLCR